MAVSQELVAKFKADTADFNNKVKKVNENIQKTSYSVEQLAEKQAKLEQRNQRLINSQLRLDASTQRANASALKASVLSQKAIEQADKFTQKTEQQSASMSLMSSSASMVASAIGTATVAVGAFSIKVGSDMESASKRIEAMLGSAEKANFVISQLRDTGYTTGASVIDLANSYGKLATFVENGSVSLQESIDLQRGLTNTATALGAGNEQLSTVMYGLSQALGSGIVRAEEFNQVTEPLPGIINRMEQATGLASGELRKMINDGLITSEMFKKILIPALASFETQADKMASTLKVQAGILSNTFVAIGEDIYDNLESPLASATIQANKFLQSFLSVKRASTEEIQGRLNNVISQKTRLSGQYLGRQESRRGDIMAGLNAQENELKSELISRSEYGPIFQKTQKSDIQVDPALQTEIQALRGKLSKGGKSKTGTGRAVKTEAQKKQDEELRIRESAIASAKQSIATAEAEVETMRMLSHEKKIAIELNKLQAVGVSENSKQYQDLSNSLTKAFTAEMRMREELDLEKYVRNKKNETEALADNAKFIGMTSHEIAQYNLQKELQIDLEEKALLLSKEGFEAYKQTAEAMVNQQSLIMEQNKAFEDSFSGGWTKLMTQARENILTEADLIKQGYDIMSSNISDTLIGMADGTKASFKDMARSIIKDIQNVILKALIMQAVTGVVNSFMPTAPATATASAGSLSLSPQGFISGARANGGAVQANKSYLVGERGAEILTMGSSSGYVHSNEKSFGGGGGSMVVNIDARGASVGVEQDIRRVMNEVQTLKKQVPNIAISAVREQNSRSSGFLR